MRLRTGIATAAVLLLTVLLFTAGIGAAEPLTVPDVRIVSDKNIVSVSITASFDKSFETAYIGAELYLFALRPHQSTSRLVEYAPELSVKATSKDVSVMLPLDGGREYLYCKYLFALKSPSGDYVILTTAKYVENPEILAVYTHDAARPLSKKGLQSSLVADAQILGAAHTNITIGAGEIVIGYMKPVSSIETIEHKVGSKTVYMNAAKILELDKIIKSYTEAGIHIFLSVVNSPYNPIVMSAEANALYYPGADRESLGFAFNTRDADAVVYLRALFEFLAERYAREDKENGFVSDFIIGYEANNNRRYSSAGPMDLNSYMYGYSSVLRIADTALRSYYSNGRVYASVSNHWSRRDTDDVSLDYAGHPFLLALNSIMKQGGDIPWNLSVNAYASSIGAVSAIWRDTEATDSLGSKFMTMKNIGIACEFVKSSDIAFNGAARDVIIGDFGINADPGSESELGNQAASYAYAYYNALKYPEISALIYNRQIDSSVEQDLYFGLWSNRTGSVSMPNEKKPLYSVFKMIDVTDSSEMTSSVLGMIGADMWGSVVTGIDESSVFMRQVVESVAVKEDDVPNKYSKVFRFGGSKDRLSGFYAAENAVDIYSLSVSGDEAAAVMELMGVKIPKKGVPSVDVLEADLDEKNFVEFMGIGRKFTDDELKKAKYIGFTSKVALSSVGDVTYISETAAKVNVMLRMSYTIPAGTVTAKETMGRFDGQVIVYEGTAEMTANEWTTLYFDISEFTALTGGKADSVKIWVQPDEKGELEERKCSLMLAELGIVGAKGLPLLLKIFLVILIIVLIAAVLFAAFIGIMILRANYIREQRRKERELARRRRPQNGANGPRPRQQGSNKGARPQNPNQNSNRNKPN
jgi:hypothetical protein